MNVTTVCLLPLLAALHSGQPFPTPDEDEIYGRAMDRVLATAQSQLEKATKLHEERNWANAWQIASKHYTVRSNDSYALAKSLGTDMDQMAPMIRGLIKPDFPWPASMPVWVVPDSATYNQIGNAGGDAHSSVYGSHYAVSQATQPVVVVYDPNIYTLRVQATHSVVHQFVGKAYPNTAARPWVHEGLASYLSLYWSWDWGKSELARFTKDKQLIPIRMLLTRSTATYGNKAHQHFIELGMFFNYLLHYREDTKSVTDANKKQDGPFADYLRKVLAGKNIADHPVQLLLFRKTSTVEKGFRAQKF